MQIERVQAMVGNFNMQLDLIYKILQDTDGDALLNMQALIKNVWRGGADASGKPAVTEPTLANVRNNLHVLAFRPSKVILLRFDRSVTIPASMQGMSSCQY